MKEFLSQLQETDAVLGETAQKRVREYHRLNGIPFETYNKLVNYVEFNNIRYKNYPLWDCRKAAWIPYNIGFKLPPN